MLSGRVMIYVSVTLSIFVAGVSQAWLLALDGPKLQDFEITGFKLPGFFRRA